MYVNPTPKWVGGERGGQTPMAAASETFELADYGYLLRRRWWIILLAVTLCMVVAAVGMVLTPREYKATAQVLVTPLSSESDGGSVAGGRTNGPVNPDTEA